MSGSNQDSRGLVQKLLWSLWTELGVPGPERNHAGWWIDPEPLILFTAGLADLDVRLRDEAIEWCIHHAPLLSKIRLKKLGAAPLVRGGGAECGEAVGRFLASIAEGSTLRLGKGHEPYEHRRRRQREYPDFERASLLSLRLRAIFGVSAKAELVRAFLAAPDREAGAAELALEIGGYTSRALYDALEDWTRAGLVDRFGTGKRYSYRKTTQGWPTSAEALPRVWVPSWTDLLAVLRALLDAEQTLPDLHPRSRVTEVLRVLGSQHLTEELDRLGIQPPDLLTSPEEAESGFREWVGHLVEGLSEGEVPGGTSWERHGRAVANRVETQGEGDTGTGREATRLPRLWDLTAEELDLWARRHEARGDLPALLGKLVTETCSGSIWNRAPSGSGVDHPGWDAVVDAGATGNEWVPAGRSVWEVSCDGRPLRKIREGYSEREENPPGEEPSQTSLVFLTPRRVRNGQAWAAERTLEGPWKQVRILDGEGLAAWLASAPVTRAWFARKLGLGLQSIEDLESVWDRWSVVGRHSLPADLIRRSRDEEAARVRSFLTGEVRSLALQADSVLEGQAFLAAVARELPEELREGVEARCAVIRSGEGWEALRGRSSEILVVTDDPEAYREHLSASEFHCAALVTTERSGQDGVRLRRASVDAHAASLEELPGMGTEEAMSLARRAGRRLEVLRSLLVKKGAGPLLEAERREDLLPFLLLGGWNREYARDLELLEGLAPGRAYADLERLAERESRAAPLFPLEARGSSWFVAAPEFLWEVMVTDLEARHLERLREVFSGVFGPDLGSRSWKVDPREALKEASASEWRATRDTRPSEVVRRGLLTTLGCLTRIEDREPSDLSVDLGSWLSLVVREILTDRAEDWRCWEFLGEELATLAEAAPDEFLDAVDALLDESCDGISRLIEFRRARGDPSLSRVALALAPLLHSPEHRSRTALALGGLCQVTARATGRNQSLRLLEEFLTPWGGATTASNQEQRSILDLLGERWPEVVIDVLVAILEAPARGGGQPFVPPRWRSWAIPEGDPTLFRTEAPDERLAISERLVGVAIDRPESWSRLVPVIEGLPEDPLRHFEVQAISKLSEVDKETLGAFQHELWRKIEVLRAWSEGSEGQGSATLSLVEDLDAALRGKLGEPPCSPDLLALFSGMTSRRVDGLQSKRAEVVRRELGDAGPEVLLSVADAVEEPWELGEALAELEGGPTEAIREQTFQLLQGAMKDTSARSRVLLGRGLFKELWERGPETEKELARRLRDWPSDVTVEYSTLLPFSRETWDRVRGWGREHEAHYWKRVRKTRVEAAGSIPVEDLRRALSSFLGSERSDAAVDLCQGTLEHRGSVDDLPIEDVLEALEGADASRDPHRFGAVLRAVAHDPRASSEPAERLEKKLLGSIDIWNVGPVIALGRKLEREPEFLAECVAAMYRPDGGEEEARESHQQAPDPRLHQKILRAWTGIPGLDQEGTLDERALIDWTSRALRACEERRRITTGVHHVAEVLVRCPEDPEDARWPHRALRQVLEDFPGRRWGMRRAVLIARMNSRGMTVRGPFEGGRQERELASKYREDALELSKRWPQTAALLRDLAEAYERDALKFDARAEERRDKA